MSTTMQHLLSAVNHAQHANPRTQRMVREAIAYFITLQAMRRMR